MTTAKMHADELAIDAELVSKLVAAQFPAWASLTISPVPSAGTDNKLFRLGDRMVVRLPKILWAVDYIIKEFDWLTAHGAILPLVTPTPMAMGVANEDFPWAWAIYGWINGTNPTAESLTDWNEVANQLAQFVVAMGSIEAPSGVATNRGVALRQRHKFVQYSLDKLDGIVDVQAARQLWNFSLEIPQWNGGNAWVHGDIKAGNLLESNGAISAVIDFGCLSLGDPACDLIVAWNMLPISARNTFRLATGVDDATWLRGRGWALSIALIEIPYYLHTNAAMIAEALYVISQILDDFRQNSAPV